jgi:hypothetical protein
MMAVLLAVVGGLGLAGTMSINVLERMREKCHFQLTPAEPESEDHAVHLR